MGRKESVSGDMDNSSGFFRIYRGYYVFDAYSTVEKVIGINNFDKIKKRRDESKVSFLVEGENDLYFNCFQHFLLRTGFIGAFLYILLCLFCCWIINTVDKVFSQSPTWKASSYWFCKVSTNSNCNCCFLILLMPEISELFIHFVIWLDHNYKSSWL